VVLVDIVLEAVCWLVLLGLCDGWCIGLHGVGCFWLMSVFCCDERGC
jgi:hypothetical protein